MNTAGVFTETRDDDLYINSKTKINPFFSYSKLTENPKTPKGKNVISPMSDRKCPAHTLGNGNDRASTMDVPRALFFSFRLHSTISACQCVYITLFTDEANDPNRTRKTVRVSPVHTLHDVFFPYPSSKHFRMTDNNDIITTCLFFTDQKYIRP